MRTRRARTFSRVLLVATSILVATGAWSARAEDVTLTVWSHEADEPAKVAFREQAARDLETAHPGVHVKITWYEKDGLYAALKTALPAGQGPDVFYVEPDQTEYITRATSSRSTTWSTGARSTTGRAQVVDA